MPMNDRFKFRIPEFTDKDTFTGFQYIELGDEIYCTLCGNNGEPQQCTGLKDKNGKLIYEGDIITYLDYLCEIIYKKGSFILEVKKGKKDGFFHFYDMHKDFLKVIGNIYENKEILNANN